MIEDGDDICRNYHRGDPESEDANGLVAPHKSVQRCEILRVISQHPEGIHCEAIERALGMKHQTTSARIAELRQAQMVEICGYTQTSSGARARLYAIPPPDVEPPPEEVEVGCGA